MRQGIFRVLAGLLSIGAMGTLFARKEFSIRDTILFSVFALVFGVYAVMGREAADNALALFLGHSPKRPTDDGK
jgi:hypothetical protein